MSIKDGFDSKKRWGNSAMRGHGVNSPAMMEARKGFASKSKALGKKKEKIYVAAKAPGTAFKRRNEEEQKEHENYYKTHKGHYEYR